MFGLRSQSRRLPARVSLVAGVLCFGLNMATAQDASAIKEKPIGRAATPAEIAAWNIDIEPNGAGLPPGSGTVALGKQIYDEKCITCHGPTASENPGDTGIVPNLAKEWCCATTLYDYIHRAMPYFAAQSLKPDEIYSLVALLLYWSKIVPENFVADAKTIPAVKMPAAPHYSMNPWTSGVIPQPGNPWSREAP
jgi:mono/diheme cytochrome c family protein